MIKKHCKKCKHINRLIEDERVKEPCVSCLNKIQSSKYFTYYIEEV